MSIRHIRCPSRRPHGKRVDGAKVLVDACGMYLGSFEDTTPHATFYVPCKNCKRLIKVAFKDNIVDLAIMPPDTKINGIVGSCAIDGN